MITFPKSRSTPFAANLPYPNSIMLIKTAIISITFESEISITDDNSDTLSSSFTLFNTSTQTCDTVVTVFKDKKPSSSVVFNLYAQVNNEVKIIFALSEGKSLSRAFIS